MRILISLHILVTPALPAHSGVVEMLRFQLVGVTEALYLGNATLPGLNAACDAEVPSAISSASLTPRRNASSGWARSFAVSPTGTMRWMRWS